MCSGEGRDLEAEVRVQEAKAESAGTTLPLSQRNNACYHNYHRLLFTWTQNHFFPNVSLEETQPLSSFLCDLSIDNSTQRSLEWGLSTSIVSDETSDTFSWFPCISHHKALIKQLGFIHICARKGQHPPPSQQSSKESKGSATTVALRQYMVVKSEWDACLCLDKAKPSSTSLSPNDFTNVREMPC